jgi:ComF family protein
MAVLSLDELKRGITHLFYPLLCEGCNKPLVANETVLCIGCAQELPETAYHTIAENDAALRFSGRVPYERVTVFAYFTGDGLLQHLLHGLKYRGRQDIGRYLGGRFGENLIASDWLSDIDLIIPVPLHPAKEAIRGYNQSLVISEAIGAEAKISVQDGILKRIRETESQTKKSRAERAANMEGAFALHNHELIKGKHILLFDDVLTTGATLEACANALLKAENVKISIATIGIAIS